MSARTSPRTSPRTSMVTGATAGIGHRCAGHLAARGDNLVLVARDEARLADLAEVLRETHGAAVEVLAADLSDRAQLRAVEERLADTSRPVGLLVNNAGYGLQGRFLDNGIAEEQAMLDVLCTAVLRLSHAALGTMTARGGGAVINVSSVAAFLPRGTYAAAKAWVNHFSAWAAQEYAPRGVRVMALCPGFTRTEFHARMDVSFGSAPAWLWLDADRVVTTALADLERGRVLSIPSRRYRVIATVARVVPGALLQRLQSLGRR